MLLPSQLAAMKLGRKPSTARTPVQKFGVSGPSFDAYSRIMSLPRLDGENTIYSDCVETAAGNCSITKLGRESRGTAAVTDQVVLGVYSDITGFPKTDDGTIPEDMWEWWKKNAIGGVILEDYATIDPTDEGSIRNAIARNGCVSASIALSLENQNQRVLKPDGTSGSWGLHEVCLDGFDGAITSGTSWGQPFYLDRSYFSTKGFVEIVYNLDMALI